VQGHHEMTAQHKISLAHKTFMLKVWSCWEKLPPAGGLVLSLRLSGGICSAKVVAFRAAGWALHQQTLVSATYHWSAASAHMACHEQGVDPLCLAAINLAWQPLAGEGRSHSLLMAAVTESGNSRPCIHCAWCPYVCGHNHSISKLTHAVTRH